MKKFNCELVVSIIMFVFMILSVVALFVSLTFSALKISTVVDFLAIARYLLIGFMICILFATKKSQRNWSGIYLKLFKLCCKLRSTTL